MNNFFDLFFETPLGIVLALIVPLFLIIIGSINSEKELNRSIQECHQKYKDDFKVNMCIKMAKIEQSANQAKVNSGMAVGLSAVSMGASMVRE